MVREGSLVLTAYVGSTASDDRAAARGEKQFSGSFDLSFADYISMCTFSRFGMKPSPSQELVNSAQTSESHEITKVAALKEAQKSRNPRLARAKKKYESQRE